MADALKLCVLARLQAIGTQLFGQGAAFLGQVQGAVGGLFGHRHHVVQARAGIVQLAGLVGHGRQFAQGLAQLAGQPREAAHHRLGARGHQAVDALAPGGLVTRLQCIQGLLQAQGEGASVDRRIHQALAARRSKILPSFSSRVCAVNGLMM